MAHTTFTEAEHDTTERHTIPTVVPHDADKVDTSAVGAANGVSSLDADTKVVESVKKIQLVEDTSEPAVAAGEVTIWHDTTSENEHWYLIYGTDGTTGGNKKVELS